MTQLSSRLAFGLFLTLLSSLFDLGIAIAQIIPDNSLGSENSQTRSEAIKGIESDVIEGGATRRSNLFHSFKEFSIKEGRGAYFANPAAIENIFTRVTGGNVSNILGTLGVLGNANLFLINPSGIIFGPNARLDLRGAFIGSTADSLIFDNNFEFSATNPDAPPLLTVNIPIGLRFREKAGDISSTGNLTTLGNLTLKAGNLNLSGSLAVGGDLTLEALNTLTIRDTPFNPFTAVAGGKLLLQGNQGVDIYALNHPQSGLISGSDLILRSANAISGDAHFWSGGSFRIERLDGSLGGLVSLYDPVIRASGDVSLDFYTGTSLHILAGGSVYIPGTIQITGVDETGDFLAETVTLSDGSTINIDGSLEPTLDIRAGTTAVGSPFFDTGTPTSADIFIGDITFVPIGGNGGKVFLSNQYQPNTALQPLFGGITVGSITTKDVYGGGSVTIDSRSGINLNGQVDVSALNVSESEVPSYLGNGGDVTLLSQGNININSSILAQGLLGGNVTLTSIGDIFLDNGLEINVRGGGGGNITINAQNVNLLNASKLRAGIATGFGAPEAQAGDIKINATGIIALADDSLISNVVQTEGIANAGNVIINTKIFEGTGQFFIGSTTFGQGNAGQVIVNATEQISLTGGFGSGIASVVAPTASGNGADVVITTPVLSLSNFAQLLTSTLGQGNAGNITIHATKSISLSQGSVLQAVSLGQGNAGKITIDAQEASVSLDGSETFISTSILVDQGFVGTGQGDDIIITAKSLDLTNGSQIFTSTSGKAGVNGLANAGNIFIKVADAVSLRGGSGLSSSTSGEGNAGGIEITTDSLSLAEGASVNASTFGKGDAGAVKITATDTISVAGKNSQGNVSGIFSQVGEHPAEGNAGGIEINTGSLSLNDGAQIDASTFGIGNAGAIKITASDTISVAGENSQGLISGIFSQVASTGKGNSEGIEIITGSLFLNDGAAVNASTLGIGNAGAVKITATDTISVAGENSQGLISGIFSRVGEPPKKGNTEDIEITKVEGNAGGIEITTGFLSLNDGAVVDASTFGRGNAGVVKITASDAISVAGENSQGNVSGIFSQIGKQLAEGNAGGIEINTGSLSLNDGAVVTSSTFGRGNAGTINIMADEAITIDGGNRGILSTIFSTVESGGVGDAGDVNLSANSLTLTNGGQIQTIVREASNNLPAGVGIAGNVNIDVRDAVVIDGMGNFVDNNGLSFTSSSQIATSLNIGTTGSAGNIDLKAGSLFLTNGGRLTSSTFGRGNAGNINIMTDGATTIDGSNRGILSTIFSTVESGGVGDGGDITINASLLALTNGGRLTSSTFGRGNAGNINIMTDGAVMIDGGNRGILSTIFSTVESGGVGDGGDVNLSANSFTLTNGGAIQTVVREASKDLPAGVGTAGNVNINVRDAGVIDGTGIFVDNNGLSFTFPSQIATSLNIEAAGSAGNINLKAGSLFLTNGGTLTSSTFGTGDAGKINIDVRDTVTLAGFNIVNFAGVNNLLSSSSINSLVGLGGVGNGGDINVRAGSLSLKDTATIASSTSGQGKAGNIFIEAGLDVSLANLSVIRSTVDPGGKGSGGDIDIQTRTLSLTNGSQVNAALFRQVGDFSGGQGKGGNIRVNASNSVDISGVSSFKLPIPVFDFLNPSENYPTEGFSSGLFASSEKGASGAAGSITVTTNTFRIADGAIVDTLTANEGRAGDITINANTFEAIGGGQVLTTTRSSGNAGNITLNIIDNIKLSGSDPNFTNRLAQLGEDIVNNQGAESGLYANTAPNSSGKGGNITIDPNTVTLDQQARISVNSQGLGNGGNISLFAQNLTLDNRSEISATTASGEGGNITLNVPKTISQRNNSPISATAGGTGNGGNITIKTQFLIGNDNSDITANAFEGTGGNINLTADGIFRNPNSEITASSQLGIDGVIETDTPEVDPSRGLINLPQNLVDSNALISQNACRKGNTSEFTVRGRGGLPSTPEQVQSSNEVEVGLVGATELESTKIPVSSTITTRKIIPAQGWRRNAKGEMVLVAYPTSDGAHRQVVSPANCSSK